MKTKYVWPGSISPHVNFPENVNSNFFYGIMSGFIRLIMKTKYVWHSSISPHVNFSDNMNSNFTSKKNAGGGGRAQMWRGSEKEPLSLLWNLACQLVAQFGSIFHSQFQVLHFPSCLTCYYG